MDTNERQKSITLIKSMSTVAGITSDEVNLARDLIYNKSKDDRTFICEGLWAVDKFAELGLVPDMFLYRGENLERESDENLEKILKMCRLAKRSLAISEKACKKISDRDGYDEQFIIAKLPEVTFETLSELIDGKDNILAIVMDGLEQPGNIGAIMRSFDCAGGDFAIITNRKAKLTSSRLVRASLGASFIIPALETDIESAQKWLEDNNFRCIVTDLTATKSFKDANYGGRVAIIAGNEHTGISPSWRTVKNAESIIIPMLGSCESLNVGFASTLVAYEAGLRKFGNKKVR